VNFHVLESPSPTVPSVAVPENVRPQARRLGALWLLLGVAVVVTAFSCDPAVDGWFGRHAVKSWKHVAGWVSRWGDWPPLMGFAVVGLIGASIWRQDRIRRLFIAMMVAASLAGLMANSIRFVAGRTRPNAHETQGWRFLGTTSDLLAGTHYQFNSFPSAHTATAFGFAAPALLLATVRRGRRWLLLPALAVPLAIGWSRLYLHVHHFSDVVVATILGLACGIWISYNGPWRTLYVEGKSGKTWI
jgi:membrane-associated phospholipid phosphatase